MTQPPFSGNDIFDQVDSVARNLTGNAFRLRRGDPDAPQKFTEFLAQKEQEFTATQPQVPQAITPQQPQSFTDFVEAGFQVPQQPTELDLARAQAEARIADPSEQQGTFIGNEGAPGPVGMSLQALENIGSFGIGQFSDITGIAPQEFKDATAAERARINAVQASNPFERFVQSVEGNFFAPSKAFSQTRGDFPQIGVTQEAVDIAGNVLSSALPIAGIPLDIATADPTDPQANQFHIGLGELGEAVFDPLNVIGAGAVRGAGTRALRSARAAVPDAKTIARAADRISPVGVADAHIDEAGNVAGSFDRAGNRIVPGDIPAGTAKRNLADLEEQIFEQSLKVETDRIATKVQRPSWATGVSNDELIRYADSVELDATFPDWWDKLPPEDIADIRAGVWKVRTTEQGAALTTPTQRAKDLRDLRAQLPEAKRLADSESRVDELIEAGVDPADAREAALGETAFEDARLSQIATDAETQDAFFLENIETRLATGQIDEAEAGKQFLQGKRPVASKRATESKRPIEDRVLEAKPFEAVPEVKTRVPGLVGSLIPEISDPSVFRRSFEKAKQAVSKLPGVDLDPATLPGLAVVDVIHNSRNRISSMAGHLTQEVRQPIRTAFRFDETGLRVEGLQAVPAGLEARPTIEGIARDYAAYAPLLNDEQRAAMEFLRVRAEGLSADMRTYGTGGGGAPQATLGDGGFFVARGPTKKETARTAGSGQVYESQVRGIEAGEEYLPVWDAVGEWATDTYEQIMDAQIGRFISNYVDPDTGEKIASTLAERSSVALKVRADRLTARITGAIQELDASDVRLTSRQRSYLQLTANATRLADDIVKASGRLAEATNAAQVRNELHKINTLSDRLLTRIEKAVTSPASLPEIVNLPPEKLVDHLLELRKVEDALGELATKVSARLDEMPVASSNVGAGVQRELVDLDRNTQRVIQRRGIANFFRSNEDFQLAKRADLGIPALKNLPKNASGSLIAARKELRRLTLQAGRKRAGTSAQSEFKLANRISRLRAELEHLAGERTKDIAVAKKGNQGEVSLTGFRSLTGTRVQRETVNTINKAREEYKRLSGKWGAPLRVIDAYQQVRRTVGATLDDSAVGIQGKLTQFSHPTEFARAWKGHFQALIGLPGTKTFKKMGKRLQREAVADEVAKFDQQSIEGGLPLSNEIIDRGLRFGGVDTEVTLGTTGITGQIGRLPGIRRANEAFGAFGDMLRLRVARSDIKEYMQLSGDTWDELVASGKADQIIKSTNGMTGWTPRGFGGAFGDLILFAPRFFQARIETLVRAGKGMDVDFLADALPFDREIRRKLKLRGVRSDVAADQLLSRRAMVRLISWGTMITVAANEALGQETDFQLMKNGRINPNFMAVRLTKIGAPRDWNIFGPYRSMAAIITALGGAAWEKNPGKAIDAWRNVSSPLLGDALTALDFKEFGETRFGQTLPEYMIDAHTPFSLQEVPNIVKKASTGNPKDAFGGLLTIGLETIGEQNSPLSRADIIQDRVRELHSTGNLSADEYDELEPYEKNDVKDSLLSELEEFQADTALTGTDFKRYFANRAIIRTDVNGKMDEHLRWFADGKRTDGSTYGKSQFLDDYFGTLDEERNRLDETEALLGIEFKETTPDPENLNAVALQAWYDAVGESITAQGNLLPTKLNTLRDRVLRNFPNQVEYIIRNTNDRQLPDGMLEALTKAGAKKTVANILRSEAARVAAGAPAIPTAAVVEPEISPAIAEPESAPRVTPTVPPTASSFVPPTPPPTRDVLPVAPPAFNR